VLAGGKSCRMGRDKAMLKTGDQTWLDHQVQVLREAGCRRVRVATRQGVAPAMPGYDLLYDRSPDQGPLEPIAHGLCTLRESHLVVLAVDLPMMIPDFIRELMGRCDFVRGCVPKTAKGWEPLAGVYGHTLSSMASNHLARKILSIRDLVDSGIGANLLLPWELDDAAQSIVLNVNHPSDLPDGALRSARDPEISSRRLPPN